MSLIDAFRAAGQIALSVFPEGKEVIESLKRGADSLATESKTERCAVTEGCGRGKGHDGACIVVVVESKP